MLFQERQVAPMLRDPGLKALQIWGGRQMTLLKSKNKNKSLRAGWLESGLRKTEDKFVWG